MWPIVTNGVAWSLCLSVGLSVIIVSPVKTAELIEMPFGMWTRVGPRKHVLDGVHIVSTWLIRLGRPRVAAMRPFCKITLTMCSGFLSLRHVDRRNCCQRSSTNASLVQRVSNSIKLNSTQLNSTQLYCNILAAEQLNAKYSSISRPIHVP